MYRTHEHELAGGDGDVAHHAALPELAHRFPRTEKLPGQIDRDDLVPLFQRHIEQRRVTLQPGIADANVERSEMTDRLGEHGLDVFFGADVGLDGKRTASADFDLVRDLFSRFRMGYIVDDNVSAGRAKAESNRFADTGIGAGNQGGLSFKHHWEARGWPLPRSRRSGSRGISYGFSHALLFPVSVCVLHLCSTVLLCPLRLSDGLS